jgi:hypothetical protein
MHPTLTPKPSDDPHDVVVVPSDAVGVAPSDDRTAPADEELSKLLHQAARYRSDKEIRAALESRADATVPPVDTTFRPAAVNDLLGSGRRRSTGRRALRAFVALFLAACIGGAAIALQGFGYAGKKLIAKWVPQFALTTSLPLDKLWPGAQQAPSAEEADAADATAPQAVPAAPTAAEAVAPVAAPSPDSAQLLQSMARDLANVSQEVELLKASIAELKASQPQMSRDAPRALDNRASDNRASENRAAELNARAKLALAPPRPAVVRPRKPVPTYPPAQAAYPPPQGAVAAPLPQAAAAPYVPQAAAPQAVAPQAAAPYAPRQPETLPPAPVQLPAEPGFTSVPRPPMPVQ